MSGEQVGPASEPVKGDYLDFDDVVSKYERMMDWLAGVIPCGPPVADVLPALATSGRRLIVVAAVAQPALPADVTSIVPAEDITAQQGAYDGLVYTADGTVLAW